MSVSCDIHTPIKLHGDWSICSVTARLSELCAHLETLRTGTRTAERVPHRPAICLENLEAIDASGCQLLAVFLRHARSQGISPIFVNAPTHFMTSLATLGFAAEFRGAGI